MRRLTRTLIVLVLAAMLMPMLAACAGGGGKVTLTMIESLTNPERTKVLQEIIDAYEAQNQNVTIELISPPLDGADQKIQQMLQNKDQLDILEVRDSTVTQFSNNNWIEPLDTYVDAWADKGTLVQNTISTGKLVGDKWYLMPYGFYTKMIYYRKDWLDEKGIAAPTTWNELYEAAVAITDPANARYGWTLRGVSGGNGFVSDITRAHLGQENVELLDCNYDKQGKSILHAPEAKESFDFIAKLFSDAAPPDSVAWGFQDQCQAFTTGITGFLLQDPEVVAICEADMEPGTWATCPLPVSDISGQYPIGVGYAGWGVAAHSAHKDAAADFILFLSNPQNNVKFCKQYSVIPIHNNASQFDAFFETGPFAPYAEMNNHPEKYFLTVGKTYEMDSNNDTIREVDYTNVLLGEADVTQTLTKWADLSDQSKAGG